MTFTELMKFVTHDQMIRLRIVGFEDEITGKADTLDVYVCVELAETQVAEINAEQGVLNVWVVE